jgi:hypothetical protein
MAIDPTQLQQPTPPASLNVNDLIAGAVAPIATQVAQQAVSDATAGLKQEIIRLTQIADQHSAQIADAAVKAGTAVLTTVTEDVWLQRAVVLTVVGATLLGALGVVVFALLGNATANHWVGAAPAAVVALVLWLSRTGTGGVPAPKKPTPSV